MTDFTRRKALFAGLFGAGYVGLRAMATGLPAWFLLSPRRASAEELECAIDASAKMQFLVVSASSAGDPISCNVPGTYDHAAIIHPDQPEFAATTFSLGGSSVKAAQIWSTLSEEVRSRTNFMHYMTGGLVHGDHPKVMRLLGKSTGGEMWPSVYAKHLAPCLGTVQSEPVAVGASGNSLELVSMAGRTLSPIAPLQLRQLLSGSATDPLANLRSLRDRTLDDLNALFKEEGTPEQLKFLDAMATSQAQVRQLTESLAATLEAITDDDVAGQALAAAALIAAKVTPVVTLHIPFGGDNHVDDGLYDEWFQHTDHEGTSAGVPGIQAVMDAIDSLGLTDKVTFATMNVFGRDLSGTAKVEGRRGRDHFGNHAVMVMIGKHIRPGVTGGVSLVSDNVYGAAGIDSTTGAAASDGDIAREDTMVAVAKTLGVALGIDPARLDADFTDQGQIRHVEAALID